MTIVPTFCLDCGRQVVPGPRCHDCRRRREGVRNRSVKRSAYLAPSYQNIPIGGRCWICGLPGADTRDHVIGLAEGMARGMTINQLNNPTNIRPAHRTCNSGRTS